MVLWSLGCLLAPLANTPRRTIEVDKWNSLCCVYTNAKTDMAYRSYPTLLRPPASTLFASLKLITWCHIIVHSTLHMWLPLPPFPRLISCMYAVCNAFTYYYFIFVLLLVNVVLSFAFKIRQTDRTDRHGHTQAPHRKGTTTPHSRTTSLVRLLHIICFNLCSVFIKMWKKNIFYGQQNGYYSNIRQITELTRLK